MTEPMQRVVFATAVAATIFSVAEDARVVYPNP
jgi:hypothetical protein